jgi:hypothetical protein
MRLPFGIDPELLRVALGVLIGVVISMFIRGNAGHVDAKRPAQPITEVMIDWIAWIGLLAGCLIWSLFVWDKIHPETIKGPIAIGMWGVVLLLGVLIPLGLPTLLTLAMPRDPINIYLNERIEHTIAYKVQIGATALQALISLVVLYRWIGSAWNVTFVEDHIFLTVSLMVFSVLMPSFSMLRFIPKHWRAQIDMADEVERRRRLCISDQIQIEAAMQNYITLQAAPLIEDLTAGGDAVAKKAAGYLSAIIIRLNESNRTIGMLMGNLIGNQKLRIQTPTDEEVYNSLLYALESVESSDKEMSRLEDTAPVMTVEPTQKENRGTVYDRLKRHA